MGTGSCLKFFQNFWLALLFIGRQGKALAGTMLGDRFRRQVVEFTRDNVLLDLTIPRVGKALGNPVGQSKKLLVRQFLDGFFDFGQRAHATTIADYRRPRKPDSAFQPVVL
jgi:hypothetical protein